MEGLYFRNFTANQLSVLHAQFMAKQSNMHALLKRRWTKVCVF